jgi:hypothetical protein
MQIMFYLQIMISIIEIFIKAVIQICKLPPCRSWQIPSRKLVSQKAAAIFTSGVYIIWVNHAHHGSNKQIEKLG